MVRLQVYISNRQFYSLEQTLLKSLNSSAPHTLVPGSFPPYMLPSSPSDPPAVPAYTVFIKHSVFDTFLFINTAIVLSGTVAVCASGVRFLLFSSSPNTGHLAP